ncbi:MAG: rhomboid family intramembrane serine protease [Planctomycetes bacterium]|nr:rhomboid family intramembrane serine protease [Planctomycetota bacterium]
MSYAGRRFYLPLPPATKTLFLINVAVFVANLVSLILGRWIDALAGGLGTWTAFSWPGLLDGYGLGLLRVVTYQFTHSIDPMHLVGNMISLWVFGPIGEARLGRLGIYRLYLWGGAVGALGFVLAGSLGGYLAHPLVGASGACYALLVYAACVQPHATIVFFIVQMPLWVLAALFVAFGAYWQLLELGAGIRAGGVAHSAHLGGALLGWLAFRFGWFVDYADFGGRERPGFVAGLLGRLRSARARRRQQAAEQQDLQLDTILAKVKEHGLGSLTTAERRFLEQISQQKGR